MWKSSGDSNKNQINREQKHSEVFGDIHASFLRQTRRVCTFKKAFRMITRLKRGVN